MSFVVQRPHSVTNNSDKYRVTEYEAWGKFVKGAVKTYPFTSFDTYEEAEAACRESNRASKKG
jgi:hypothetical protein